MEVLSKNPEIFDKAEIMKRLNDYERYEAQIATLSEQVKELEGDLQTARRESVHDRMKVEVSKLKSKLSDISSRSEADRKIKAAKMDNAVKLGERDISDAIKNIGGE